MINDNLKSAFQRDTERKQAIVSDDPELADDADFWDAHCCALFDDGTGYCAFCGALIPNTSAYYDACGCDPSE